MEQKSGKTLPHSFVEHELQMHLFKKPNRFQQTERQGT